MRDGLESFNVNQALAGGAYRPDIDGLRALAVAPVVFYHAGVSGFSGGFVGVDVFFVISGYLITTILLREIGEGRFSYLRFYERRARRIMPALLFVLAATSAGAWLILFPDQLSDYGVHLLATLGFVANLVFMLEVGDYFSPDAEFIPLLHMWSLGVEEQFYILFPAFLAVTIRVGRLWRDGVLISVCAASFALALVLERIAPTYAFYFTGTRVWELGLGALLAMGYLQPRLSPWAREAAGVAGLCLIVGAVAFYSAETPFPGLAALAPCFGAALLIGVGGGDTVAGRLLSWRPLVLVGLISYSLYLWHWPILALMRVRLGVTELPVEQTAVAILAAVAFATLSWAVVERPFRLRAKTGRAAVVALSTGGAAAFAGFAAALIAVQGAPWRLPPAVATLYAAANDGNPDRTRCFNIPAAEGPCYFGPGGGASADFLLWGDSHADALMPAFVMATERLKLSGAMIGWSACPPLIGVARPGVGGRRCVENTEAVVQLLRDRSDMGVVFLVARWALAVEGERPRGEAGAFFRLVDHLGGSDDTQVVLFERSLRQTVAAIAATGRLVVLFEGTPEFGWRPPLMMAAATWRRSPPVESLSRDAVQHRNARVSEVFRRIAADIPSARVAPVLDALCVSSCELMVDEKIVYRDGDHMTRRGAETLLAPVVSKELERVTPAIQ